MWREREGRVSTAAEPIQINSSVIMLPVFSLSLSRVYMSCITYEWVGQDFRKRNEKCAGRIVTVTVAGTYVRGQIEFENYKTYSPIKAVLLFNNKVRRNHQVYLLGRSLVDLLVAIAASTVFATVWT